jgi:hypothetical protein
MKTTILRMTIAIALAAGAWFSWTEASAVDRRVAAREQIVTLRFADVDEDVDASTRATVAYWLERYGDVAADSGPDRDAAAAEILLIAANAAFRESQRDAGTGAAAIQRLDGVLQAYASALKASPQSSRALGAEALAKAAAYNYEYVARLRDQVARSQGKVKLPPAPAAAMAGDLPAGSTIHGRPGMPPPEAKMEDIEILAPLEYGDREAQPEATPGGKRERKG